MDTDLSLRMLTQCKSSGNDRKVYNSNNRTKPNKIAVTPLGTSTLTSGTCSWSVTADSPIRQRATVLFDTADDGSQIMVSYDAPPPATRRPQEHFVVTSVSCSSTTNDDENGDCEKQCPKASEKTSQRQNGNTEEVSATSSADITATSRSELCEDEQATKVKGSHGSVAGVKRPPYDQRAASVSMKQEKEHRRSIATVTSSRRQSLGPLPSKKSTVQGAVEKGTTAGSSDMSNASASRAKKDETRPSSASRSVSSSRRSSLMKATTSSLAKRCANSVDNIEVKESENQAATGGSASFSASLASKVTKLVKRDSKPAVSKRVTATPTKYNKRLSLDASARPRSGLMTSSTGEKTGMTSRPRDNDSDRKSTNVGEGQRVTSYTRGVGASSSRGPVQGSKLPPASLTKSFSTISLRREVAKNPVVEKSEGTVVEQFRKGVTGSTLKQNDTYVQSTSAPPVTSASSPDLLHNCTDAAAETNFPSYTDGRKNWDESEYNEDMFLVVSIYHLAKRLENKSTGLLGLCDSNGKSSMKDEYELHQQMQRDSSPTDSCRLPEWNSSSPYLASTLRHLHATDHQLDEIRKKLAPSATDEKLSS